MFAFTNRLGLQISTAYREHGMTRIRVGDTFIDVPCSKAALDKGLARWIFDGADPQDAFRFLNPSQRDFVLTGVKEDA